MTAVPDARWSCDGWRGRLRLDAGVAPSDVLAVPTDEGARRSRHAVTQRIAPREVAAWLKRYPAPGARHARRAWRMALALAAEGFRVPEGILVGARERAGILVTRHAPEAPLVDAVAAADRRTRRRLLAALGAQIAALHCRGFVHGDLVPSNVLVGDGPSFVLLDHDRTRRSEALVWWGGRRNLVQLGRFVVRGVGVTDRARVLAAYARGMGLGRSARHRLARWLVAKTTARRCAIDGIAPGVAAAAGFATLMRSGGPFDPATRREDVA